MRKFSIAKIASLIFVCVMLFAALTISVCAEEATDSTDVGDVFTFSGYSINEENGDACFGFTLNHAAKDALEIVDFGFIIVSYDKLNGQSPIDANGNAVELENGNAFVQSLKGYKNTNYTFKLVNLSGEYSSRKYVITPYICDGTDVFYYNEKGEITNTVTGVSYEEMVELSPHEHTYENGYCTVCELVDPDYYFPMTIPEALNAADGTNVQVSGTVVEINYAWSTDNGNMSVTIKDDEGNTLYIYKLATEVALCDVITVKGTKTTYNETKEIGEGATATIDVKHECSEYTEATCTAPKTCVACGKTEGELADHSYGDDNICDKCGFDKKAPIVFEFGDNKDESETHADGSEWKKTDSFTISGYTFTLDTFSKVYKDAYDEMGNSAIKLGTSSAVGSFSFTVPEDIGKVIIKVSGYKANKATIVVNDVQYDIETVSNSGEYTEIVIDTTKVKTITFATNKTPDERAMIDSISFVLACKHELTTVVTEEATCLVAGSKTTTCKDCDYELVEEIPALGHNFGDDGVCTRCGYSQAHVHNFVVIEKVVAPTCKEQGYTIYACDSCDSGETEKRDYVDVVAHVDANADYKCDYECGELMLPEEGTYLTVAEALKIGELFKNETGASYAPNKYYIVGRITALTNTTYGTCTVTDETGTINVFGLRDTTGDVIYGKLEEKPAIGDTVKIYGSVGAYYANVQLDNSNIIEYTAHDCDYTEATCETLETCKLCGATKGEYAEHNYVDGKCTVCGLSEGISTTDKKYTFSEYPAGTQYAKNEEHVLDGATVMYTNDAHFTSELRLYSSSTNNAYAIIQSANAITKIAVNAGNKVDVLVVFGSNDEGATWTPVAEISVTTTSYKDYEADLGDSYKWIKLDVKGTNQVRLKSITLTTIDCPHNSTKTDTTEPNCTEAGYEVTTCTECGAEISKVKIEDAQGHKYNSEVIAPKCTEDGYTIYTCSVCNDSYKADEVDALGHTTDNGVCERCNETIGGEEEKEPFDVTISFASTADRVSQTTSIQVWQKDNVTFTNNKGSSTSNIIDSSNPVRLYANSNVVIDAGDYCITKIVFNCNSASYATALGNSIGTAATVSDKVVTVSFTEPVDTFEIDSLTAQVRANSIVVTCK